MKQSFRKNKIGKKTSIFRFSILKTCKKRLLGLDDNLALNHFMAEWLTYVHGEKTQEFTTTLYLISMQVTMGFATTL